MRQTQPKLTESEFADRDWIGTLLLVDDNEIDQMMYKRVVTRSGLVDNLIQYTDPVAAMNYLTSGDNALPDLILLDINMPGMNGFEFLEQTTASLSEAMCPVVVMLTTSLDPQDEARARNFSVVKDFMNKPLTSALLTELSELLARDTSGEGL